MTGSVSTLARKQGFGITPVGGLALAFAVLLEGVTNGDAASHPGSLMYTVAGALLALSGVTLFAYDAIRERAANMADRAQQYSWAVVGGLSNVAIQVLAAVLGYAVCKRAGSSAEGAFALSILAALTMGAIVAMVLMYSLAGAVYLNRSIRKIGGRPPRWLTDYIAALTPREDARSER